MPRLMAAHPVRSPPPPPQALGAGVLALISTAVALGCGWPGALPAENLALRMSSVAVTMTMPGDKALAPVLSQGERERDATALTAARPENERGDGQSQAAFDTFRLAVPFRTQKDGDRFQGSNCGPATLGMVLEAFGMAQSNGDLRFLTHTYQGTVGKRTGTALQHMASVARDFGLEPVGLDDGPGQFHRWTADEVRREVEAGRPVIPLVKFRLLPGHETSAVRFDHYVVIYEADGDQFIYHDPIYPTAEEGAALRMSFGQLDAAMAPALVPRQAVSFAPGAHAALAALPG